MSFDDRDIRKAMDVYTCDNVYLGTVLAVKPGTATHPGELVSPEARQAGDVHGELPGPMPTQPPGNPGPSTQSARAGYATAPDTARPLGKGTIVVGKWWGLAGRHVIPIDAVQTVSLERVILALTKESP